MHIDMLKSNAGNRQITDSFSVIYCIEVELNEKQGLLRFEIQVRSRQANDIDALNLRRLLTLEENDSV